MNLNKIKQLRNEKNISRQFLADEINISVTALATYERGEREPSAGVIIALSNYFEVTSDYILGLSDDPKPWLSSVPAASIRSVKDIKASVEKMLLSASLNPFSAQTLDAYATIISFLPEIDTVAAEQLVKLQKDYPRLRQFGDKDEMQFNENPLMIALAEKSEEASEFAKRYTEAMSEISVKISEVSDLIRHVLHFWASDAIKGKDTSALFVEHMKRESGRLPNDMDSP